MDICVFPVPENRKVSPISLKAIKFCVNVRRLVFTLLEAKNCSGGEYQSLLFCDRH